MNKIQYWAKTQAMKDAEAAYNRLSWFGKMMADLKRYFNEEHGDQMP